MKSLLKKYDVQAPRYTSYPTVPYWSDNPTWEEWKGSIQQALSKPNSSWSMYMHIPFCESLCSFCGCNTVITRSHKKEMPYVEKILKEWSIYKEQVGNLSVKPLSHIHLGGGTPTFLGPDSLKQLIEPLFAQVTLDEQYFSASIEIDPRRTTKEQLKVLFDLGFRRVSFGVQDFNIEVQKLINRVQSYDMNQQAVDWAREIGFDSVNFDLIYGLPLQTLERMNKTIDATIEMRPDRIALYSLAIVPWIKPAQRLFQLEDLPSADEKYQLYEVSRQRLLDSGYLEIGMDHFALESDELSKALRKGNLHRNFMGYTEHRTDVLLGLGVSAISETPTCFHQNVKELPVYEREVLNGIVPTLRGHKLSAEDQLIREQILELMTTRQLHLNSSDKHQTALQRLKPMQEDGLVEVKDQLLTLTDRGRPFLRNAAMAFDQRLLDKMPDKPMFSKSV